MRFCALPDRPWGPPSLLCNGYRVFPGGKERPGRDVYPSPLLVPWSRKSIVIPLLPLWAVRPVQSLSACTRVHFTNIRKKLKIYATRKSYPTAIQGRVDKKLKIYATRKSYPTAIQGRVDYCQLRGSYRHSSI